MDESGLSMSFLENAILTAQYLWNHFPSSMLPAITTPYEIVKGTKPDFLHLHI